MTRNHLYSAGRTVASMAITASLVGALAGCGLGEQKHCNIAPSSTTETEASASKVVEYEDTMAYEMDGYAPGGLVAEEGWVEFNTEEYDSLT